MLEKYSKCPEDALKDVLGQHRKAYILWLIGAVLFHTKSKDTVHSRYMACVGQIDGIAQYAWGAAVLSYLYRVLHLATRKSKNIVAHVTLLRLWTYERVVIGRPNPREDSRLWLVGYPGQCMGIFIEIPI